MSVHLQRQVRSESDSSRPIANNAFHGILQRKCACGTHGVGDDCEECAKARRASVQRSSSSVNTHGPASETIPSVVGEALGSSGQLLDPVSRHFMESRFGHDFSQVRVHTGAKAAESAQALNADAYTVGRDVVFGQGMYAPHTSAGKHLLAHELTHVVQQSDMSAGLAHRGRVSHPSDAMEREADSVASTVSDTSVVPDRQIPHIRARASAPRISCRVAAGTSNCPSNTNGAPANPITDLTRVDTRAQALVQATATLLAIVSALVGAGIRNPAAGVELAYRNTFGLPPARPRGFLNRLTGVVRPSLEAALAEEMGLLADRYALMARFFGQNVAYRCRVPDNFGGCAPTAADCAAGDAVSCNGVGAIWLCATFWGFTEQAQAGVLIHEAAHIIWANVIHGARGPGGNFRHAECYAELVAQIFGFASAPTGAPCNPPGP